MLQQMLAFDPEQRISAEAAMRHPYLASAAQLTAEFYAGQTDVIALPQGTHPRSGENKENGGEWDAAVDGCLGAK